MMQRVRAEALTEEVLSRLAEWRALVADAGQRVCLPDVSKKALDGLKFSQALPERLAMATLAASRSRTA